MNPGRELDALVAEKVFGHVVSRNLKGGWSLGEPDYYDSYGELILWNPLPPYSEDISSAWQVIEKLKEEFKRVDLTYNSNKWLLTVQGKFGFMSDGQETASHAICIAALRIAEEK